MYLVVAEFLHVKPGKGAAFVRSKLKNYVTGNSVERTFRAGEQVQYISENDVRFADIDVNCRQWKAANGTPSNTTDMIQ